MLGIWLYSIVLVTENKSALLQNAFLTRIVNDLWQLITKKDVDNRPDTPGNKQVLSDMFGSCRVYPSINKYSKPEERVETGAK